jgi:hypothetical protein
MSGTFCNVDELLGPADGKVNYAPLIFLAIAYAIMIWCYGLASEIVQRQNDGTVPWFSWTRLWGIFAVCIAIVFILRQYTYTSQHIVTNCLIEGFYERRRDVHEPCGGDVVVHVSDVRLTPSHFRTRVYHVLHCLGDVDHEGFRNDCEELIRNTHRSCVVSLDRRDRYDGDVNDDLPSVEFIGLSEYNQVIHTFWFTLCGLSAGSTATVMRLLRGKRQSPFVQ